MKCPSFEQLIDHVDGKLTPASADSVATHVADCEFCAKEHSWYRQVRTLAATDDSTAPPPWVLKRAVRIFEGAPSRPRLAQRIGQVVASLVFDSFARPQLAGVRSTETASRQLLYRAGEYSIDLQVAPSAESSKAGATGADLIGQVLREGETTFQSVGGLRLQVARGGEAAHVTVTDPMGEFKISNVVYGVYDLRVELADGQITVPEVPITQA